MSNSLSLFPRRGPGHLVQKRDSGASLDDRGPFSPAQPSGAWSVMSGQSPQSYERIGANIRIKGFQENAVVSACIRTVADLIAAVRIEVQREGAKGDLTPDLANPAQLVLDNPRPPAWSRHRTLLTTAAHLQGYGNAYWVFDRNGVKKGLPKSFQIVHPENVQYVYLDPTTLEIQKFDWVDRRGQKQTSDWNDVIHFKDLTLDPDALFGFPRGAAALLDMVTDGEATEYVRQIVTNYGAPGVIISLDSIVTEDQAKKADARFHELMIERGERGRTRFLPKVNNVYELGQTLRELEFPDLRAIAREDICAVFGVDPRMIAIASAKGSEGGLSGSQYQEARRRLLQQTCIPLMTLIESELDMNFCTEFGTQLRARFSPEAIAEITESEEETSVRVAREFDASIITLEEARRKRGLPEKMKPTDHQKVGGIVLPVVLQLEGGPSVDPADPGTDPGETPPGGASGGAPPGNEDAESQAAGARQTPPAASFQSRVLLGRNLFRGVALTEEQRTALWQSFDQRATREELAYRRAAIAQFVVERQGVAAVFGSARSRRDVPPPGDTEIPDDRYIEAVLRRIRELYAEDADYHAAWLDRYRALIGSTFRVAGADVAAAAGVSFDLENPRVQDAIARRAKRLADHVTQTTADNITAAIAAGREAGMGLREIADLVDETCFASAAPVRSTMIARTESAGALNQGEFESAKATGVLRSKSWLSQRDGDVRESHQECDGEGWIPLEAEYSNGLQHPGDPSGEAEDVINCRCAQLFSDEEPS